LLNEVSSLFDILKYVCNIVVEKFTFAISSPDEFLFVNILCACGYLATNY